MVMKKSFILYNDLNEVVKDLNNEQAGKLFKMILNYTEGNEVKADDLILKIAFTPIKLQLDRDSDKYEKYIDKQRENGAKGGRPKNPTVSQKTQRLDKEPKKPDTDTDTDTVTDSDNANDNVTVIDIKYPFESLEFYNEWQRWIKYKKDEHRFSYKTQDSQETALNNLFKDSGGRENIAIEMINQSIGNGYKGIFKLKNNNGQSDSESHQNVYDELERIKLQQGSNQ